MKQEKISLGKKGFWYYVRLFLLTPIWLIFCDDKGKRKSWAEFTHGLIHHKCEFDYDNPRKEQYWTSAKCKHFGCNIITDVDYKPHHN